MTDKVIHRITLEGQTGSVAKGPELIRWGESYAKDNGYIRLLDLDPIWKTWYDAESDCWDFQIVMQCIFQGSDAWEYSGMTQGKLIAGPNKKH